MSGQYSLFSVQVLESSNKTNTELHDTVTFREAKSLWQSRPLGWVVPQYCKMDASPSLECIYPQSIHLGENSNPTLWYTFPLVFFKLLLSRSTHLWMGNEFSVLTCNWNSNKTHTLSLGCLEGTTIAGLLPPWYSNIDFRCSKPCSVQILKFSMLESCLLVVIVVI